VILNVQMCVGWWQWQWQWQQNAGDDDGDSACGDGDGDGDDGCHGPTGMVKVCAAVYLIYSFLAWCLKHGYECSRSYQNPVRILI